jgi:hypothetical protein
MIHQDNQQPQSREDKKMNDSTLVFQILEEAKSKGFLGSTEAYNPCYRTYVNKANNILGFICSQEFGTKTVDVVEACDIHPNTARMYLAMLVNLGFVEIDREVKGTGCTWKINHD